MTQVDEPVRAGASASPFIRAIEPITATNEELRAALADCEIPPLLPALAYATGDLSLLRPELRPDPLLASMPQAGLTDDQLAEARDVAFAALVRFRDGGSVPAPAPDDEALLAMMEYAVGEGGMRAYLPLLEEEFGHRGEDRRAPRFRAADVAPHRTLRVVVIGAGMSGLLAAHRLQQAGITQVTVVDKNDGVGGTWWENTYPGCRVDNPNHNYSYSFAQRHDWPYLYSNQPVLRDYFAACAEAFGLTGFLRLGTEVLSLVWSDGDGTWAVTVRGSDGTEEVLTAEAVVSATGQLNRPLYPTTIPGFGTFAGPAWHSATWNHDVPLAGKRVAVIGTGASAMQLIPEIAPEVGELLVFQRTPAWLAPTPDYHDPVPAGARWLYAHVPGYSEFHRFSIFWKMGDGALARVRVDPDWDQSTGAVSEFSAMVRELLVEYYRAEFGDRPDLLAQVLPDYVPGSKRMVRDNGIWARTLKRDNVQLVTTGIEAITPTGVRTVDGVDHDVDVLIYGTGFQASRFLTPMRVVGRNGVDLHEQWGADARAHLGITVPGFPNLFCLYGPNTNIVVNGSIVYFSECGVRYILGCLQLLLERDAQAIEVRQEVHDRFNEAVDAENGRMAWGVSSVNTWYKNDHGRITQNWPFTLLAYWERTLAPNPDDFHLRS